MKNIAVITGTRAEYHLLYPLLKRINESNEYILKLVVTGSHLSEKYGETYKDIEKDNIPIDVKIPILDEQDDIYNINIAISKVVLGINDYFQNNDIDLFVILGDRYELLPAAMVALNYRIPIAHINGGDTTEGAIDESIRHSITKMSSIHFPTCDSYRKRIIQLGEDPKRVFNVGGLGVENALSVERMTREELAESLGFDLDGKFAVITFHPVTLEANTAKNEVLELLRALDDFPDLNLVFTKSNADSGGLIINQLIDEYVSKNNNRSIAKFSLGLKRYMSALSYADIVIGNSSSGILETPSFSVPTINIGDRQKGRIQAKNILNALPLRNDIVAATRKALSNEFKESVKDTVSPYGNGHTSEKIIKYFDYFFTHPEIFPLKKSFYNIEFTYKEAN